MLRLFLIQVVVAVAVQTVDHLYVALRMFYVVVYWMQDYGLELLLPLQRVLLPQQMMDLFSSWILTWMC